MARQISSFTTSGTGPGSDFTVLSGSSGNLQITGGVLQTNTSSDFQVRANTKATTESQYAQFKMSNNTGLGTGPFVGGYTADCFYVIRHNGSELAIRRRENGDMRTIASASHTRASGQVLRLEMVRTETQATLTAKVNGTTVVSGVDLNPLRGYYVGYRLAATSGVQIDDFDGGDIGDVSAGTNPTTPELMTRPVPNPFRGLIDIPGFGLMCPGEVVHDVSADFLGASGAYTPPSWLTLTGTAATPGSLTSSASDIGRLKLDTTSASDSVVELSTTQTFLTSKFTALRIDVTGLSWSSANPSMEWRLFADDGTSTPAGGGIAKISGEDAFRLYSNVGPATVGSKKLQWGLPSGDATRRRSVSLWMVTASKELYVVERDTVVGYYDASNSWTDGAVKLGIKTIAKSAALVSTYFTGLRVRCYA